VKTYMDICAIKRPFDDQTHPRVALETAAVLVILQADLEGRLQCVRSAAHDLENSLNPDGRRAAAVQAWLDTLTPAAETPEAVAKRASHLAALGFGMLDAFHLAWAENLNADTLVTCDDRFIACAARNASSIKLRVVNPLQLVGEL